MPWHLWKTSHGDTAGYVLLLGAPEMMVPGGSSACVVLFDAAARRIGSRCFQTGWRFQLGSASFEYSADLGADLVVIHTFAANYPNVLPNEYFALRRDALRIVRLEDEKREAVQNEYLIPNAEIGFAPEVSTVSECAAMLESADKAEVLAEQAGKRDCSCRPWITLASAS